MTYRGASWGDARKDLLTGIADAGTTAKRYFLGAPAGAAASMSLAADRRLPGLPSSARNNGQLPQ